MEIMTPPISPTHEITSTSNYLCERGSIAFHCLGDAEKKASFDPRGFLVSGAITNPTIIQSRKSSFVTVFNQEFDMDISKDDLKRLFRICWNKLCLIDSTQKMGSYGFTSDTVSPVVNVDEVRQDLREFFAMLHLFVESQGESVDKSWILKETLPTLLKGLDLLRNQLGFLSDLPSYVLSHSQVKNSKSPGHHLFHWHLEARWLHISVLWALSECLNSTSIFEATEIAAILQPYSAEQSIENLLQSTIKFCIIDLVEIAVLKFNKLNQEMIVHSSPFHCLCVKELWLLLKFITESLNDHDTKAFWKQLDECLQLVVKADAEIPPKKGWRPLQTKKFQNIVCLEPGLFALWLLRDVGEIYMFTPDGLLSPVRPEMDKGQGIVKCVLNNLIGSNDLEEPQRRTLISLIKGFMDDPWKPKPEPIMMLWEGFSRKLDCAFQCPGAPASSFVIASDTIEDILSSVNFEPSNKPRKQLNSFELFLSLLATYLAQDKNVWKAKICGRFYSKLSEKKVNGLSEMGVFHLTQVFLSIALATEELEELGGRFFGLVSFCETDKKRNQMIMKAKLCFVFLFIKHGKALSPLAGPLTNTIDSLIVRNQKPIVQVFIANLEIAIRSTDELPSDFHILFGPWVKKFLDQNHQDTTMLRSLLNLMIDVMQKLQVYMDCNNIVGGGMQELVKRLHENLLPYLKDQKSHDWEIADLAFQFTLISLEFNSCSIKDNFQNLVHHFTTSDNFMLVKRYLHRILSCRKITNIIDANESLQILFVQAWVRCCMCSNVGQDRETEVAQQIFLMPVLKNTFNLPADNFVTFSDPLLCLVEAMGKASSANKKIIAMILEPLQQLIPLIKSSLFPAKSKDISWVPDRHPSLDNDSIERSYLVFATLTAECPSLIYEKNKSSNLLVTLVNYLILHPHVFNMDVKLPLPMENGVRNSLLLFIKGLFKLDPKREKCIERFLKSIIKVYVPRYIDPFTKIWDEPEDMPSAIYIIQSVCETLLQVDKNNVPHKYYCQGLTLMNTLIQRNGCDEILIGLLIDNVLPNCLYVVAKVTDMSAGNRRQETEHTLGLIFDTEVFQMSISLREQATNVLNQQSHKFLSFNASLFMRMLLFLMKVSKPLVKSFYPTLEKNVRDVISKRGSGNDKNLETFLAKVKEGLQI